MDAKPKILVVDDDRSICKLMGSILEMESYPFRVATSVGAELVETLPNTEIIGATPKMVDIYKKVAKIARIEAPVLVVGESGSGKELVARALHVNSERARSPFIVINCGALPENLLES